MQFFIFNPVRATLAAAFCLSCAAANFGDAAQVRETVLEGKVCDVAGGSIEGAAVNLEDEAGQGIAVTKTNVDGLYVLKAESGKNYRLHVSREGFKPRLLDVDPLDAKGKRIDIVLELNQGKLVYGMEFSDSPNFTIAGVTDWSNVGLHGSDTNMKTSEELAKETAALKSNKSVEKHVVGAGDAHRLLGDEKEKGGDPVAAVHEYEAAVQMEPSEENYFAWGTELVLHRAGVVAVQVLSKGAELHPKSERMRMALGAAHYSNGQYSEAAEEMCRASDLNPADAEPYLFLGKMEQAAKEVLPCTEEKLGRFAKEQPGKAQANFYYGLVLWKKARRNHSERDFDVAEESFRRAVTIDPAYGEVYLELGMLYNARGKKEMALAEFKKAIAASPNPSAAHYQLSLAYRRAGETSKADEEMKTYTSLRQSEEAALEKERREMRQFVTVLKQKDNPAPH